MIQIDEMANVAEDAFTDRVILFDDTNALFFFFLFSKRIMSWKNKE